jgi:hypothetical protein
MTISGKVVITRNVRSEGRGWLFTQGSIMDLHTMGNKFAYVALPGVSNGVTYRVPKDAVRVVGGSENA